MTSNDYLIKEASYTNCLQQIRKHQGSCRKYFEKLSWNLFLWWKPVEQNLESSFNFVLQFSVKIIVSCSLHYLTFSPYMFCTFKKKLFLPDCVIPACEHFPPALLRYLSNTFSLEKTYLRLLQKANQKTTPKCLVVISHLLVLLCSDLQIFCLLAESVAEGQDAQPQIPGHCVWPPYPTPHRWSPDSPLP